MFGFKIVREDPSEKIEVPKFDVNDFNTRKEAQEFVDILYIDGAISKLDFESYSKQIYNTKTVKRYITW
jgi:hypothetical protein